MSIKKQYTKANKTSIENQYTKAPLIPISLRVNDIQTQGGLPHVSVQLSTSLISNINKYKYL